MSNFNYNSNNGNIIINGNGNSIKSGSNRGGNISIRGNKNNVTANNNKGCKIKIFGNRNRYVTRCDGVKIIRPINFSDLSIVIHDKKYIYINEKPILTKHKKIKKVLVDENKNLYVNGDKIDINI